MYSKMGGSPYCFGDCSPNGLNKARFNWGAENLRHADSPLVLGFLFSFFFLSFLVFFVLFLLSFSSFSFCPSFFSFLVGQVVTVARIF